jgi:hypothetical protein
MIVARYGPKTHVWIVGDVTARTLCGGVEALLECIEPSPSDPTCAPCAKAKATMRGSFAKDARIVWRDAEGNVT